MLTPAPVIALLLVSGIMPEREWVHLGHGYGSTREAVVGLAVRPPAAVLRLYHTAYLWAEDLLLARLARFDRTTGTAEELEPILGNLVWLQSPRGVRPTIALLAFVETKTHVRGGEGALRPVVVTDPRIGEWLRNRKDFRPAPAEEVRTHRGAVCRLDLYRGVFSLCGGPAAVVFVENTGRDFDLVRGAFSHFEFIRPAERALQEYGEKYMPVIIDELLLRVDRLVPGDDGRGFPQADGTRSVAVRPGAEEYKANHAVRPDHPGRSVRVRPDAEEYKANHDVCVFLAGAMSEAKYLTRGLEVIKARLEASPEDKVLIRRSNKAVDLLMVNDVRHEIPGSHLGRRPAWLDKYTE